MKYNLKNRPKAKYGELYMEYVEEWFEGFEKELRDTLELTGDFESSRARGRSDLRREILGDATIRKKSDNERAT